MLAQGQAENERAAAQAQQQVKFSNKPERPERADTVLVDGVKFRVEILARRYIQIQQIGD